MQTPIEQTVKALLQAAVKKLSFPTVQFEIERPKNQTFGDVSASVALVLFSKMQEIEQKHAFSSPREIAQALVNELTSTASDSADIANISIAGPGFINFTFSDSYHLQQVQIALKSGSKFGSGDSLVGKKIIVEYSSPNIAKPFTVGHLRSTVIGDAIAAILEFEGGTVLRDNHVGDWGTQFGKQIYAIRTWGDKATITNSDSPVKDLVALYVRFHEEAEKNPEIETAAREWFKKLEDGDAEARELWRWCVDLSWVEFSRIYALLGIAHSKEFEQGRGLGESFFEDKMGVVLDALKAKGLLREGEQGAQLVFFPEDSLPPAMILKNDGATLYHTRDLATDYYRLTKYQPDLIVNEVGSEQSLYFKQLFAMEEMLGWYKNGQRVHVGHGLIRFKDGKMSTRKGNVIWLEEILQEAIGKAGLLISSDSSRAFSQETKNQLARQVGIGALKWNDLKGSPQRSIVFDWEDILTMKGNSGPYIQYTYARSVSVLNKALENAEATAALPNSQYKLNEFEIALARSIAQFPSSVRAAVVEYAPQHVAASLFDLASAFNTFYNHCPILKIPEEQAVIADEVRATRLHLTQATAQVLKTGLRLLGIEAPEKM